MTTKHDPFKEVRDYTHMLDFEKFDKRDKELWPIDVVFAAIILGFILGMMMMMTFFSWVI